jgi:8-oxo-dGTP pyrophosphatase MutT (NUDIX family)
MLDDVAMIDPGGPVDPTVSSQPVDEVTRPAAFTLMAPGWYPPENAITQSYGFCFTADGLVVLVQAHDDFWNLPGGQLEPGETARDALIREVAEEACAQVIDCRYLACQHVWDPEAPDGRTSHYQTRWWARVRLDPWEPRHETIRRFPVPPHQVLSTLSWRSTTIAERLLAAAVACNQQAGEPGAGRYSAVAVGCHRRLRRPWRAASVWSTGKNNAQPIWSSRRSSQLETASTSQPA